MRRLRPIALSVVICGFAIISWPANAIVSGWIAPFELHANLHRIDSFGGPQDRVYFASGSSELGDDAKKVLNLQAKWLLGYRDVLIDVEGYADLAESNPDELSARRAEAAKDYLVTQGVAADRIKAVAYGNKRPLDDNRNSTRGQDLNRRAVSVITGPVNCCRPSP